MAKSSRRSEKDWPIENEAAVGRITTVSGMTYVVLLVAPYNDEWFYGFPVSRDARTARRARQGEVYGLEHRNRRLFVVVDGKIVDEVSAISFQRGGHPLPPVSKAA